MLPLPPGQSLEHVLPSLAVPGLAESPTSRTPYRTRLSSPPSIISLRHSPASSLLSATSPPSSRRRRPMFLTSVRASRFRSLLPSSASASSDGNSAPTAALDPADPAATDGASCFGVGHEILGIDIGGTSIKAAPVDTQTGKLLAPKFVLPTPQPATPENCAQVLKQMADHFHWDGAVGVGVPAVVKEGTAWTAANIDKSWIGAHVEELFSRHMGLRTTVVNDADAAGYAEMGFGSGSGENERGVVFVVTFGTGIGTSMFVDGILVPNLELGHIELDGMEAEHGAAGVMVQRLGWTWDQWAEKVSWYLSYIERLFWPSRFIVGGGVSNAHEEWLHKVKLPNATPILPASMKNDAGIVGAAMAALARAAYDISKKPQFVEDYINA